MFKKRTIKGQVRSRPPQSGEPVEEEESTLARVLEIREEQKERQRTTGVDLTPTDKLAEAKNSDGSSSKSISSMMTGQYKAGKEDLSVHPQTAHTAIMEKYIAERLGANRPVDNTPKTKSFEDELYSVPAEIKKLAGTDSVISSDPSGGRLRTEDALAGAGVGLAEVILPSEYRMKNIQETELAKQARKEEYELKKSLRLFSGKDHVNKSASGVPNFRYAQGSDPLPKYLSDPPTIVSQPASSAAEQLPEKRPGNFPHSTDDAAVGRFLKKQRQLHR